MGQRIVLVIAATRCTVRYSCWTPRLQVFQGPGHAAAAGVEHEPDADGAARGAVAAAAAGCAGHPLHHLQGQRQVPTTKLCIFLL